MNSKPKITCLGYQDKATNKHDKQIENKKQKKGVHEH